MHEGCSDSIAQHRLGPLMSPCLEVRERARNTPDQCHPGCVLTQGLKSWAGLKVRKETSHGIWVVSPDLPQTQRHVCLVFNSLTASPLRICGRKTRKKHISVMAEGERVC